MKKPSFLPFFLGFALFLSIAGPAAAQGRDLTVPKGTTVNRLGPGHFKLTTPEGLVIEFAAFRRRGKAGVSRRPEGASATAPSATRRESSSPPEREES